jgi:glycosyltransferase involved in cell wall biosynthesis
MNLPLSDEAGETAMRSVWIIVPAYNEGPVVGAVVRELLAAYPNVVVVDDGSNDDTFAQVQETEATVIRHVVNLGQGAALRTGIDYALSQGAQLLVTFDADGQHRVSDVKALIAALMEANADIALGSRFLGSREGRAIPAGRRVLLQAAILFTRVVSGIRLTDAHNGLRAMRGDAARKLSITQARMAHASEILHGIVKHRLRYVEVPVTISYTARSRMKGQVSLDALNVVFDLAIRRLLR